MIMNDSAPDITIIPYCIRQTYQNPSGCAIYSIYLIQMNPNQWDNLPFVTPVNYTIEEAYRFISGLNKTYLQRKFKIVSVIHL